MVEKVKMYNHINELQKFLWQEKKARKRVLMNQNEIKVNLTWIKTTKSIRAT